MEWFILLTIFSLIALRIMERYLVGYDISIYRFNVWDAMITFVLGCWLMNGWC
jgi:hypothetical protein